jgi:predicted RNase H-like nuclease (RuvC/YqgF family)
MDLEQIVVLEEKIAHAVQFIEQLKAQNQKLQNEIRELRSEAQSRDLLIQQLKEENQNLNQKVEQSSIGKDKEDQIRLKIEQMLSKLDELESM